MTKKPHKSTVYQEDDETLDLLMREEGIKLSSYDDTANKKTIGVGHLIKKGEEHLRNKRLTKDEALGLFRKDVREHQEGWIDHARRAGFTQERIASMTAFVFNTGSATAANKIITMVERGDEAGAEKEILSYHNITKNGVKQFSPQLFARRQREASGILGKSPGSSGTGTKIAFRSGTSGTSSPVTTNDQVIEEKGFFASAWDKMFGESVDKNLNITKQINAELEVICQRLGRSNQEDAWMDRLRQEGTNTWQA